MNSAIKTIKTQKNVDKSIDSREITPTNIKNTKPRLKKSKPTPVVLQLPKNIGAIQISNDLTSIERKIMNVILWNATIIEKNNIPLSEKTMMMDKRKHYRISFSDLENILEWENSKNRTHIVKSLENLMQTSLKFNILGTQKTDQGQWSVVTTLLNSIMIGKESNSLYYSFSDPIKDIVVAPTLYATLNLEMQNKIDSKYTLALWEYLVGETVLLDVAAKSSDNSNNNVKIPLKTNNKITRYISIEAYREMIAGVDYNKNGKFKEINRELIKKPLQDLTNKQMINATVEYKKHGRMITDVRFIINDFNVIENQSTALQNIKNKARDNHKKQENEKFTINEILKINKKDEKKTDDSAQKDKITLIEDEQKKYRQALVNNLLKAYNVSEKKRQEIMVKYDLNHIETNIKYIIDNPDYHKKHNKAPLIISAIEDNYTNYSEKEFELNKIKNEKQSEETKIENLKITMRMMVNPYVKNSQYFLRDQVRDYRIYKERNDSENLNRILPRLKQNLLRFFQVKHELEAKVGLDSVIKFLHLQSEEEMWKKLFTTEENLILIAKEIDCYPND